jgi:homeobox protein cut-like
LSQILHTELETSVAASKDQLALTSSELEKQKALNEKLENDLLAMNKHSGSALNGDVTSSDASASQTDVLAGLDLGKKSNVSDGIVNAL